MFDQQANDVCGGAIANPKPYHFRRRAMEQAQSVKVAVLCDQKTAVLQRHVPDVWIWCTTTIEEPYVKGGGKYVNKQWHQTLRQLFVEEQSHGSDRDGDGSALPFGRIGQASADVVLGQLWKIRQQIRL